MNLADMVPQVRVESGDFGDGFKRPDSAPSGDAL
jgi:hypothetical protein